MSLTTGQVVAVFKNLGKILYLGKYGAAQSLVVETYAIALTKQFADAADGADAFSFKLLTSYDVPFVQQVAAVAEQLDNTSATVRAAVDNFLLQIAPALSGTTPATVAQALADQMTTLVKTVATEAGTDPFANFALYFSTNYEVDLPSSGSPDYPDTWITGTVV